MSRSQVSVHEVLTTRMRRTLRDRDEGLTAGIDVRISYITYKLQDLVSRRGPHQVQDVADDPGLDEQDLPEDLDKVLPVGTEMVAALCMSDKIIDSTPTQRENWS